jgi:molybdopterin-biosynthesis enzyme MoeA-like protein
LLARFPGEEISEQRRQLVTFPAGVRMVPNPFNRIPGFMANDHYFVPGFPQMAHPMIEWALDTFYRDEFKPVAGMIEKAFLLTGPLAYESALLDLMERIVRDYPSLRLFSLPSLQGHERRHLELGVEGEPALVERAMEEIRQEVERRDIAWTWRP